MTRSQLGQQQANVKLNGHFTRLSCDLEYVMCKCQYNADGLCPSHGRRSKDKSIFLFPTRKYANFHHHIEILDGSDDILVFKYIFN